MFNISNNIPKYKKVLILAIDGMDPAISERLMAEGELQNFARLKRAGYYSRLKTVYPAESSVVWASFATGLFPQEHGIFDFIMRNPENYALYLGLSDIKAKTRNLRLGKFNIPVKKEVVAENILQEKCFWDLLSEKNIPVSVYFHPHTFPARAVTGRMISGMGVPDICGTMGRYYYYTEDSSELNKDTKGKLVPVARKGDKIEDFIYGPKLESKQLRVPFEVILSDNIKKANFKLPGSEFTLEEGQWSDFYRITFKSGFAKKISAIAKFYLKSVQPFRLYLSPLNIDPQAPYFAISHPGRYSEEISNTVGLYHTQGMPHANWPYIEGILEERAFLEHVDGILEDKQAILNNALEKFDSGCLFFYFEALDIIQHMFFRQMLDENSSYNDVVHNYYLKMDAMLGGLMDRLGSDTLVVVVSDHGFCSYDYVFDLNRWLIENGYLVLSDKVEKLGGFLEGIDWHKTKAYALGYGNIYFNRLGREQYGILTKQDADKIGREIKDKLISVKNPDNSGSVVYRVYDYGQSRYPKRSPDMHVGLYPNYSFSWETALGGASDKVIANNTTQWSGTHFIDPDFVPGVIFSNRDLGIKDPKITDISEHVLKQY